MDYPFPDLSKHCPVCERPKCAIYRGYFRRFLLCPEMEFVGWVIIRTGWCKSLNRRFALIPDFLMPRCKISRLGHLLLQELHLKSDRGLYAAIDDCLEGLGDEFYLPRSTVSACLRRCARAPPGADPLEAERQGRCL